LNSAKIDLTKLLTVLGQFFANARIDSGKF
jgi:hypothetical protein